MEETTTILDHNLMAEEISNPEQNLASGGKRFANMIIDVIVYYAIFFIVMVILGMLGIGAIILESKAATYVTAIFLHFLYFTSFESFRGKTVGKMITRTRVVDEDGNRILFSKAATRSLCRFIPFEAFTFLGGKAVGLHDKLSKTRVINDRS
jgi:uncharacterized RDD family membrane protein YckC